MDAVEERFLTVREVARMLQLNERTVIRLATDGEIPGDKLGGQWRFSGRLIKDWLEQRMLQRVDTGAPDPGPAPSPDEVAAWERLSLADLLPPGNVRARLSARSAPGLVFELAELAQSRGYVRDALWLAGALALRESLQPTATGHGIALLHARQRIPRGHVASPFILIARSAEGLPFGAPDGEPTRLFFLLALVDDSLHLRWLAHLSRALLDPQVRSALLAAPDDESLHAAALSALGGPWPVPAGGDAAPEEPGVTPAA